MNEQTTTTDYPPLRSRCRFPSGPKIAGLSALAFVSGLMLYYAQRGEGAPVAPPAPTASKTVLIAEDGIYSLGELTRRLRSEAGALVYVDRRAEKRRLFVSRGRYTEAELTDAMRRAAGLGARRIADTTFLAQRGRLFRAKPTLPVLPRTLLTGWETELMPVGEAAAGDTGFPPAYFRSGRAKEFADLSAAERERVKTLLPSGGAVAPPARVRFGTCYLLTVASLPTGADGADGADGPVRTKSVQIYYDFRDRLGANGLLPDD